MSICSGFFLSRRRTPRWVVGYSPGFPGITAASESTVAQWQQAPTKRSPELLKSSIAEKKSTHQQGKKKALLIHSSIPLGVADWPVGDPEDWHLEVGCSLACTSIQRPYQGKSASGRAQRSVTAWHFPRASIAGGPSWEDHQQDGFHPKSRQLDWAWLSVAGRECRCPQMAWAPPPSSFEISLIKIT